MPYYRRPARSSASRNITRRGPIVRPQTECDDDWMGRYSFTGGTMPSHSLLPQLAPGFHVDEDWRIDGSHDQRTFESWLKLQDLRRDEIMPILQATYGVEATLWFHRWRVLFMACAELFGYRNGREGGVSHYRFSQSPNPHCNAHVVAKP